MGACMSSDEFDPADFQRYPVQPRENHTRLGLPSPPQNGFDPFLKLIWCRDMKEEKEQQEKAEKEAKAKGEENVAEVEKKYYLCIQGTYEPYGKNEPPIPLGTKRGQAKLPKWDDPDNIYEILRNSNWWYNDAFILEKYPKGIRPPESYPYVEQYVQAYQHHNNGEEPTQEQCHKHKIHVVATLMEVLEAYPDDKTTEIQKLKDILESMLVTREELTECEAIVKQRKEEKEKEEKKKKKKKKGSKKSE